MCAEASIGPTTQYIRSLFSQYERVNNPILSDFISSIPNSLSDAVKSVREQLMVTNSEDILSNRRKLAKHIAAFHSQAGTDFAVVDQSRMNIQENSSSSNYQINARKRERCIRYQDSIHQFVSHSRSRFYG